MSKKHLTKRAGIFKMIATYGQMIGLNRLAINHPAAFGGTPPKDGNTNSLPSKEWLAIINGWETYPMIYSPPPEGWQAKPDGVVL